MATFLQGRYSIKDKVVEGRSGAGDAGLALRRAWEISQANYTGLLAVGVLRSTHSARDLYGKLSLRMSSCHICSGEHVIFSDARTRFYILSLRLRARYIYGNARDVRVRKWKYKYIIHVETIHNSKVVLYAQYTHIDEKA